MSNASSSKINLLLMGLLCIAPLAASYWTFYFSPPTKRVNYGDLLETKPLPEEKLTLADGTPFEMRSLQGKWLLLTADSGNCDEYCRYKLFSMRQLRLGQGKDSERIERVWLLSDSAPPAPDLGKDFQGTRMVKAQGSHLLAALPASPNLADNIYVIDPLGNWVLRFPRNADAHKVIMDITRLLKASRIG